MSRTIINFWLDTAMLVNFLAVVLVSVVVRFIFPPAASAEGWTLWSWTLDQWIGLQFVLLSVFVFGVLLHLMLHWNWVCGVLSSRLLPKRAGKRRNMDEGSRTILGVGLLIVLLNVMGLAIAAAVLSIQGPV